jgi:Rrf2 family iron-sulfur cluster assembly transcriptional regulator
MQKLHKARLVTSYMGPEGGFCLSREPQKIVLLDVIETAQWPINLNRCLLGDFKCPIKRKCSIRHELSMLQQYIEDHLNNLSLANLVGKHKARQRKTRKPND